MLILIGKLFFLVPWISVVAFAQDNTEEKSKSYQVPKVTVTAKKFISPILNPLVPEASSKMTTEIITRKEIEAQSAKTTVDAIEFAPNVIVTSRGRKMAEAYRY